MKARVDEMIRALLNGSRALTPGKRLVEDLGLDSLKLLELVSGLEDELGVSISLKVLASVKTLGDLHRVVGALQEHAS
jgi:acyl carrier protein